MLDLNETSDDSTHGIFLGIFLFEYKRKRISSTGSRVGQHRCGKIRWHISALTRTKRVCGQVFAFLYPSKEGNREVHDDLT